MPKGYAIADTKKWTDFKVIDFDLKTPEDDDVDVDIQFCGVCVSLPSGRPNGIQHLCY